MWAVAPAHRLRPLADELAARMSVGAGGQKAEGKRRRGGAKAWTTSSAPTRRPRPT